MAEEYVQQKVQNRNKRYHNQCVINVDVNKINIDDFSTEELQRLLVQLLQQHEEKAYGNILTYPFFMPEILKPIFTKTIFDLQDERITQMVHAIQSTVLLPIHFYTNAISPITLFNLMKGIIEDPDVPHPSKKRRSKFETPSDLERVSTERPTFLHTFIVGMQQLESNFKSNFWNATSHMPPSKFGICSKKMITNPFFQVTIDFCKVLFQVIVEVDERLSSSEAKNLIECGLQVAGMKGEELALLHMQSENSHLKSYILLLLELANPTASIDEIFTTLPETDNLLYYVKLMKQSFQDSEMYQNFINRLQLPEFDCSQLHEWFTKKSDIQPENTIKSIMYKLIDKDDLTTLLTEIQKIIYSENILLFCVFCAIRLIAPLVEMKNKWAVSHADVILHLVLRDEYTHIILWGFLSEFFGEVLGLEAGFASIVAKNLFRKDDVFLKELVSGIYDLAKEQNETLLKATSEGVFKEVYNRPFTTLWDGLMVLGSTKEEIVDNLIDDIINIVTNLKYSKDTKYGSLLNKYLSNLEKQSPLIMELFNERLYSHF